jgi:nicotinate-nucleotide adenylyltransferase
MRVGLFGGTFDPVHRGHLEVARRIRQVLQLDIVWLIPARVPPHRSRPRASAAHRFAMASLAIQNVDGLLVSDVDMETDGPSYTTDTLTRLTQRGLDPASAYFIVGADAFRDITGWKDYPDVLDRCRFVVVSRPGSSASDLPAALPTLARRMAQAHADADGTILLADVATPDVSSTDVRRLRAAGRSLSRLLPASVVRHISRHDLYAPGTGDGTPAAGGS